MEQLQELARQVQRKTHLEAVERSLRPQIGELEEKTRKLERAWSDEQRDVEKLKERSLTALLYELLGKKEEKLEQEQREAMAAAAKYQAAAAELEALRRELETVRVELERLRGCEGRYAQAYQTRMERLKAEDPIRGPQILELEREMGRLTAQKKELQEAISAGRAAMSCAQDAAQSLDSAEGWGAWDMFGGGLIADMAKRDHLDQAQSAANRLQNQLRHFRTELTDVQVDASFQLNISSFLGFADWFFDGLFVDWTVQSRIHDAQNQIARIQSQIWEVQRRLEQAERQLETQAAALKARLDRLVTELS